MTRATSSNHREILSLLSEVSRALRCCQQEETFCENVTFSQFMILDAVAKTGTLGLSDLHAILAVEKSTTTRLVDPLAKRGLIVRKKSRRDSRAVNLKMTNEGKEVLGKVWNCLSKALNAIETEIPEDSRAEIYRAVMIFSRAVQKACTAEACIR